MVHGSTFTPIKRHFLVNDPFNVNKCLLNAIVFIGIEDQFIGEGIFGKLPIL